MLGVPFKQKTISRLAFCVRCARLYAICKSAMNSSPDKRHTHHDEAEQCLARSVVDTLAEEPTLEAVTFDPAQQKISVATLGRTDVEKLTQRLTNKFQSTQNADPSHACSLLSGKGDCAI